MKIATQQVMGILLLVSFQSALTVKDAAGSGRDVVIKEIQNPDVGKSWVVANAGGVNNTGGGGLAGQKCSQLIPKCTTCSVGFKTCLKCADYSSVGGFAFEVVNGACAMVIGFDDLAAIGGAVIAEGYRGLSWDNLYALSAPDYGIPSGYPTALISPPNVAFNGYGNPAAITSSGFQFTVVSVYAAAAWNDNLQVTFVGRFQGQIVAQQEVVLDTTSYTKITFNGFVGIDRFEVSTSGGVQNPVFYGSGTHVALDNLVLG